MSEEKGSSPTAQQPSTSKVKVFVAHSSPSFHEVQASEQGKASPFTKYLDVPERFVSQIGHGSVVRASQVDEDRAWKKLAWRRDPRNSKQPVPRKWVVDSVEENQVYAVFLRFSDA